MSQPLVQDHKSSRTPSCISPSSPSSQGSDPLEEQLLERIKGDAYIVDWYGASDKGNPQNLPLWRKWAITMSVALYVLTTTFASSALSAASVALAGEFGVEVETMVLAGTSMFLLGFATGPILFGSLSERFGRTIPLFTGYLGFILLQLPVAEAHHVSTIFVARFLQGVFGAAPSAVLSGMLADIWTPKQRGFAMPAAATFLSIGPILGPIVGSIVVQSPLGWRWIELITAIGSFAVFVVTYPLLKETYSPALLARRANRMRRMTRNWALRAKSEEVDINFKDLLERYVARPAKMLVLEPILLFVSLYISIIFGLMYNLFLAYPMSFMVERGWSATDSGLPLISILVGTVLGGLLISSTINTRLGGRHEARLPLMMLGAVCLPAGILIFAWASSPTTHPNPWPQVSAGVPIGLGIQLINMQGMNYIVDCYGINANSAMAAVTFMRSVFASGFPIFAKAIYVRLGVPLATSVLACLGAVMMPVPVLLYSYGESIRAKSKWTPS